MHHSCQQYLVAEWLGLSVTVRVRVRARVRKFFFFFFLTVLTSLSCTLTVAVMFMGFAHDIMMMNCLEPRLSVPDFVSQLWRKIGGKAWTDFSRDMVAP